MKDLTAADLELIKLALSFLATHVSEAEDHLDVEIDGDQVKNLEAKLYQE